mmetsp:Transcript_82599/g.242380  ORF Transcript_82599/g.242380 Transcript_82599/m.242380 type:complete len:288 (-) Transcript_82599:40-903(-)
MKPVVILCLSAAAQGANLHGCALWEGFCWGKYSDKWCWLTHDGKRDWAKSKCNTWNDYDSNDYCEDAKSGHARGQSNDASTLIADCAQKKLGTVVDYKPWKFAPGMREGQCTELAMQCIADAKDHGCPIADHPYHELTWSNHEVQVEETQPGDIAQFKHYRGRRGSASQHTSVVAKPYDGGQGILTTYDQNPKPVHQMEWMPHTSHSGSVRIFRLHCEGTSRLYSADVGNLSVPSWGRQLSLTATSLGTMVIAAAAALGLTIVGLRRLAPRQPPHGDETELLEEIES